MLFISAFSILVLAIAYRLGRRSEEQRKLKEPRGEMLRLGVQIICGDCSGDTDRPVKTYLDQLGRCGQCCGRAYVLASACARRDNKVMGRSSRHGETTAGAPRQTSGPQVRLDHVLIRKVSA